MQIQVVRGDAAEALLANDSFRARWTAMAATCPWAGSCQSVGFARAWYSAYRHVAEPVLVFGSRTDGELAGLIPLTHLGKGGALRYVGLGQAEYQSWICRWADAATIPPMLFDAIQRCFPSTSVQLRYLAPGTPLDWMASPGWRSRVRVVDHDRPLIDLSDQEFIAATPPKKSKNRGRRKHLDTIGKPEIRRITDPAEFDVILDTIAPWCDFRQASVHGVPPFADDPGKKPFYRAMYREAGVLHATGLFVDGRIVAVNMGAVGPGEVQLGLIAHDPRLGKLSIGTQLVRHVAKLLASEGYQRFDLTAGGDLYKNEFANASDQVQSLTVYPSSLSRRVGTIAARFEHIVLERLARAGVSRRAVKLGVMKVRSTRAADVPEMIRRALASKSAPDGATVRAYTLVPMRSRPAAPVATPIRRDQIDDLLAFDRTRPWMTRQEFLSEAIRRMGVGQHVYTAVEDGRLVAYGWLSKPLTASLRNSLLPSLPATCDDGVLVYDCHVARRARRKGLGAAMLQYIVRDALTMRDRVYAMTPKRSIAAMRMLDRLGFVPIGPADPAAVAEEALNDDASIPVRTNSTGRESHHRAESSHPRPAR